MSTYAEEEKTRQNWGDTGPRGWWTHKKLLSNIWSACHVTEERRRRGGEGQRKDNLKMK